MSESTATVSPVQPAKLVKCKAGFRLNAKGWPEVWIQSPRTGNELTFTALFYEQLRKAAPRVIGRIAQARSIGMAVAELSTDELHALVKLRQSINCQSFGGRSRGRAWGA